jgi:hypothetical protein
MAQGGQTTKYTKYAKKRLFTECREKRDFRVGVADQKSRQRVECAGPSRRFSVSRSQVQHTHTRPKVRPASRKRSLGG